MHEAEKCIFTNMCMIYDADGNVVVQERTGPVWPGIAFPGGHVEKGESMTDAVIREIYEETGLTITEPRPCGIKEWLREDGTRYIVLLYKTDKFSGTLTSSDEGKVYWLHLSDLKNANLASGMVRTLRIFLEDSLSEQFCYLQDGKWIEILR